MLQLIVLAVSFLSILYSSGRSLVNAAKFRDRGGVKLREGSSGKKKTVETGPLSTDLRSIDWRLVGPYKTVTFVPVQYNTSTLHRVNPIITIGCCTLE